MFSDFPDILSTEELAEMLNIGRNSVYKIINSGEIESFIIGKTHKIPKQAVADYIIKKCSKNSTTIKK